MNRRRCATAAITLVCALTVLTAPGTAFAAPLAPNAPNAPSAPGAPLLPGAPLAPLAPAPPSADAAPRTGPGTGPGKSLDEIRLEIESLYHQAVSATDAYNLAEEETKRQSAEIVKLAQEVVKGQARIDDLKARAGAAARAQYRGGGLPPEAHLLLTDDPQLFLDGAGRIQQGMKATRDLLNDLDRTQAELASYSQDASAQWRKLETNRIKQAAAKKKIDTKIAAARKIENALEKEERARLLVLERQAAERAQAAWLRSGALQKAAESPSGPTGGSTGGGAGQPAGQGHRAVEYAKAQIGKPYGWGAEGPGAYDCSGLTSQAWSAAGKGIPRTSQEQWRQLPKITMSDIRPGDLIIYHADASHVGMYIGEGSIVHAPRPGRYVSIAGAGSMKILGVVRPDR
ncbi:NlpC/P60 family protein [Streptomyces sp. NPDC020965]|uniref:C40 family peptidase n=1 Tax=Streptomyces sp. NPDC020965 TaxID=3365105 RepID=UPI0037BC55E7